MTVLSGLRVASGRPMLLDSILATALSSLGSYRRPYGARARL